MIFQTKTLFLPCNTKVELIENVQMTKLFLTKSKMMKDIKESITQSDVRTCQARTLIWLFPQPPTAEIICNVILVILPVQLIQVMSHERKSQGESPGFTGLDSGVHSTVTWLG